MAIKLSNGERRFLKNQSPFLEQALVEVDQRDAYVKKVENVLASSGTFELREAITPFGKADTLDSGNTSLWNQQPPSLIRQFLHEN